MKNIRLLDTTLDVWDAADQRGYDLYHVSNVRWVSVGKVTGTEGIHSQHKVDEIAADIKERKVFRPIIVDEDYYVIDGHHRLAAVEQLGWDKIPVVMIEEE